MINKKTDKQSLEDLLLTAKQIAALIDDNNQNMKDCFIVLKKIQKLVSPEHVSIYSRCLCAIRKILNKGRTT